MNESGKIVEGSRNSSGDPGTRFNFSAFGSRKFSGSLFLRAVQFINLFSLHLVFVYIYFGTRGRDKRRTGFSVLDPLDNETGLVRPPCCFVGISKLALRNKIRKYFAAILFSNIEAEFVENQL